jgi:hypothetical protein
MNDNQCKHIYSKGPREGQRCSVHFRDFGYCRFDEPGYCGNHTEKRTKLADRYKFTYTCINPETKKKTICKFARMQQLKRLGYLVEPIWDELLMPDRACCSATVKCNPEEPCEKIQFNIDEWYNEIENKDISKEEFKTFCINNGVMRNKIDKKFYCHSCNEDHLKHSIINCL